jgi:predicted Zn-dependent peptidase
MLGMAAGAQAQFDEIQSRISEFSLDNGIKFIVLERHQAPVVSFYTHADVGSAQEVQGTTGLAHLFEHMAFKGSKKIGTKDYEQERVALGQEDAAYAAYSAARRQGASPEDLKPLEAAFRAAQTEAGKWAVKNEFDEAVERAGGRGLNANTASDRTVFFFSLPSNASELWFYLDSERFYEPVLREFYKERDVVMEERRLSVEGNPVGKLIEELLSVAYKAHSYKSPTIGFMSDLQNLTRADAQTFFGKYYVPSNLTAVVVGDVDVARIHSLADAYFGRIPKQAKPEPLRTVEPPQAGERYFKLRLQSQRVTLVGYHKPGIQHPDNAVYDALGSLLSEGRSSRLYRSLVRDQKIAVEAGGFPGFPGQKYPGLFLFYAFTAPGHENAEVEKGLEGETQRLCKELVSAEELDGVKRRARANLLRQLDDNAGLAMQLADWQGLTGDWHNLFRQLDKINAVTPADIQRVAKATFTEKNRTVGVIEPAQTSTESAQ